MTHDIRGLLVFAMSRLMLCNLKYSFLIENRRGRDNELLHAVPAFGTVGPIFNKIF